MANKYYIKTFGCQMNEYDSEKIGAVLSKKNQLTSTSDPNEADLIILNTCSIREKAEVKVFSDLGRFRELKASNPNLRIAVGGCVASQEGENIIKRAPFVDLVFGPQSLHRVSDLLNQREISGKPQIDISFPEIEKFDHLPADESTRSSASVSIMEGCSKYCSFCVVPYTRGEEISRPLEGVLNEIVRLTFNGVSEITLLGQNVNAYRGVMSNGEIADFSILLEYVAEIDEIKRIRFTTSHPNEMTDNLINCFKSIDKLAKAIHLPMQSGSDRVLSAMKRNYTSIEYKSIIRKLRKVCPDISLTSDFIIGFPNETDLEFMSTLNVMKELEFDYSYSFLYSPRPGTPASYIEDNIPNTLKQQRLEVFQNLNATQGRKYTESMKGTVQRVLFDHYSVKKKDTLLGKTDNNRVVEIASNSDLLNKFVSVRIVQAEEKNLKGEILA
ncbi:MAG TPA: tRNA (N6-isopentenyl adenosine(37)-C2)-methylthiotransferase MiaB [Methylophilaceae bacterium]|jgi:tRNA-2-methylthio-N6-dimethylallyladenosine synthase|nr:tRNA (N6-isopentenyl adenosine(37)-C2)-methylthiotransferase MiaB [Methylophilaceae bacterium]|tara:strand:+ start:4966 stop:6291 length:1326 start_codon:yes stop_codon:yes gene_type:complete